MEMCCGRTLVSIGKTSYYRELYACPVCGLVRVKLDFKPRKEATLPKIGNRGDWTKKASVGQKEKMESEK